MVHPHPLNDDAIERNHFESLTQPSVRSEYRRLLEKLTGYLPDWAVRQQRGRKPLVVIATADLEKDRAAGMTYKQIAQTRGVSIEVVRKRLYRARKVSRL